MTYFAGQGAILKMGAGSGASLPAPGSDTFNVINLVGNLKLPSNVRTVNTFKTLDSADPRKVGGGFEERTVAFRLVFDPADAHHTTMRTDAALASSTTGRRNWQIILPDSGAAQFDFVGFIQKWEWEELENEKEVALSVEIAVDGAVTYTP
jgi:hypothetical protein